MMKKLFRKESISFLTMLLVLFAIPKISDAQVSPPNQLVALKVDRAPRLDGILNEDCWGKAVKISNFTQRELNEGEPASEKTQVAVVYTNSVLYIGVWCYDRQPEKIVAKEMKRDFRHWGEDDFEIIIDTYNDQRNGYFFITNPNGAREDILITDEGRGSNKSWNGVWDVATKITNEGWFAEIEIPFSTLKFPNQPEQIWGINFERNITHKNEQVLWQAWSRDYDIEMVSHAGKLVGLKNITGGNLLEIKPYLTAGLQKNSEEKADQVARFGGDLNYLITSNLKLNVTLHTDFAQIESDRARINLSRFSLYYPEKRGFFLEGSGSFDFSLGGRTKVFYSRRIGIKDGEEIPIIGGVRLLGKQGKTNVGVLSIQTAEKEDEPTTNYSVVRLKQDVLGQSYVGMIATAKNSSDTSNYVYGVDFGYASSKLFGDKNIRVGGAVSQSQSMDQSNQNNSAYRFYLSMPNDFVEYDLAYYAVQKNFNPEIGFLRRSNFKHFYTELQFNPRPSFLPWIRQMEIKPIDVDYYWTDDTNELESVGAEWRPLGFGTKSGEWFEYNIQRFYDRLSEPFEIHDNVELPVGKYWYTRHELQLSSFRGRKIYAGGETSWGAYYTGNRTLFALRVGLNLNKHLNISADYERNNLKFPEGSFTTHESGGRIEYAFNPKLFSILYGQWNNEDHEILLNFRLNWIPKIGSDFYLAINQKISTAGSKLKVEDIVVLSKLVWRFAY